MSGYTKENQCRNFAPNIFNKNKCQNCFKPRETHLLSDKDLNKATPIYVGWLLLAPIGTDFSNPTHRTRKWQRRYFILFEHGALRYALDDNANTLPQGTINMNQCTDVVHAESLTGQKYSLCIYHPEMKYFIRSESRDDTTGWYDQLIVFPQTVKEDALNKKKISRRFPSTKATPATGGESNKRSSPVTYDALRSPKSEVPPQDRIVSPTSESQLERKHSDRIISPNSESNLERKTSDLRRGRSISRKSTDKKQGTQTHDVQRPVRRAKSLDRDSHDLNDITIESLNQRKGWILKRTNLGKETWTKHWFVLSESSLKYYKDPSSEEFCEADGEIRLDDIIRVDKVELNENYGFAIHTVSEEITLAGVTSRIRQSWINTIEKSSKAISEKENSENIGSERVPDVFDEHMVERSMEKRARKRQRRKMGRSRTYDFAELRSAVRNNVAARSTEMEQKHEIDAFLRANSEKKDNSEKVKENGVDSLDGTSKESVPVKSPREVTTSKVKAPLTTKMFNVSHWDVIEKSDSFNNILSSPEPRSEKSSIVAACNSLKSEVEFMAKQIEMGRKEFGEVITEQNRKIEKSEKEDSLKGETGPSVEEGTSDKLRALEIAHKCAMDENKRLRDEIVQSRIAREQESGRMNSKIRDLKLQLAMVDKRSRIKASLKSHKNDRSLKDKVSELEAEMEDTGQMIDRRLTALETPRRKEADDSDEAGSSSSCSSINQLMRPGRPDEERQEMKKVNLDAMHDKLSDSIKSLQEARNSNEYSTSAVQEAFNANKASVLILRRKIDEDQKSWLSLKNRLNDICSKIPGAETDNSISADARNVLMHLESELKNVIKAMEKRLVSHESENLSKVNRPDPKELETVTLGRLKVLSDGLKTNNQPGCSLPVGSSNLSSTGTLDNISATPLEQKEKVFAQQLSHEAMIIADMAETLERYASGKSSDVSSSLLHSGTKDVLLDHQNTTDKKGLLQHAGIVAEKMLLQSRLVNELSKLQTTSTAQDGQPDFKSASLPMSVSYSKSGQGTFATHQGMIDGTTSLSLVQAQINYLLHVYNDRIARLSQDVKEAQHRADSFQQKLVELVHACKTKDIEVVSQLALEVDTKASLVSSVENLPEWRQQVDYGMLHGAEASISTIDLQTEASYFAKLSQDISRMSSDVKSLANIGSQILEIDMTLSRILKPSVIGEHASIIAYEAISQAQLLFLTRRITKDYEEQILKMKNAARKQAAHCENLQQTLKEIKSGDAVKMQQLTTEHKQKVERLMEQLSLVEQARKEMSTETDQKLNKLDLKQKRELERSEAQHQKEINQLRSELKGSKSRLQELERQHKKEKEELGKKFSESKKQHKLILSSLKEEYESSLSKERKKLKKQIDELSANEEKRIAEIRSEFRKELETVIVTHEKEKEGIEDDKKVELKILKDSHGRELENLRYDHERDIEELKKDFDNELKEKQDVIDSLQSENDQKKNDVEIDELQSFFERRFSNFEETHKRQLEDMAKGYQLEVRRLQDEKAREIVENTVSTKLAIESMQKYYNEEVEKMKEDGLSEDDKRLQNQYDKVSKEFEALSEMYSKKCAEMASREEKIKNLHGQLIVADEKNEVLEKQNNKLSSKLEEEIGEFKSSSLIKRQGEESDNVHHLKVELGAKKLEVAILHQQMESLKQQVAMTLQGRFLHGFDNLSREDLHSKKGVIRSSSERRAASKAL